LFSPLAALAALHAPLYPLGPPPSPSFIPLPLSSLPLHPSPPASLTLAALAALHAQAGGLLLQLTLEASRGRAWALSQAHHPSSPRPRPSRHDMDTKQDEGTLGESESKEDRGAVGGRGAPSPGPGAGVALADGDAVCILVDDGDLLACLQALLAPPVLRVVQALLVSQPSLGHRVHQDLLALVQVRSLCVCVCFVHDPAAARPFSCCSRCY
jgi:hypothetical protein